MFFCLSKLLFSGCLQFIGNFVPGQNNRENTVTELLQWTNFYNVLFSFFSFFFFFFFYTANFLNVFMLILGVELSVGSSTAAFPVSIVRSAADGTAYYSACALDDCHCCYNLRHTSRLSPRVSCNHANILLW